MELKTAIENLGFSEKEAAVYLALLQEGQATAYKIASRSGLKKPTTYVILDGLISRGAAHKVLRAKRTEYAATDPVELFVRSRNRIAQVESVLPELRALAKNDAKVVQTTYYEGLAGVKEMYANLLEEAAGKTCVGFYASTKDTPQELAEYWPELNAEMVKRKISLRAITTKDETTKPYLDYKRIPKQFVDAIGLAPSIYSSNISIEIYGPFTHILSHRYVQGILIRNPDVADVLRQIFEIVWKASKK
jgi:sugar-specific transcriptional regulator TrmB